MDISTEMATVSKIIIRSFVGAPSQETETLKMKGRVREFQENGTVVFEDGSIETDIGHCILATGYEFSYPFLDETLLVRGFPPAAPPLPRKLYNSTYHIVPLAEHLFPLGGDFPPTSLMFMSLLSRALPFPFLEAQASFIVNVFANPSLLDPMKESVALIDHHEQRRAEYRNDPLLMAKNWHKSHRYEQFDYRDRLHAYGPLGKRIKVPAWHKEMFFHMPALRAAWKELERSGEAVGWVEGVGEGGVEEWAAVLRKLLRRAEERNFVVVVETKPKL
jgi:hypothetical protein